MYGFENGKLLEFRQHKGWSQQQMVEEIQKQMSSEANVIHLRTYQRWESGQSRPTPEHALAILAMFEAHHPMASIRAFHRQWLRERQLAGTIHSSSIFPRLVSRYRPRKKRNMALYEECPPIPEEEKTFRGWLNKRVEESRQQRNKPNDQS